MLVKVRRAVTFLSMGKMLNKEGVTGKKLQIQVVQKAGKKINMTSMHSQVSLVSLISILKISRIISNVVLSSILDICLSK